MSDEAPGADGLLAGLGARPLDDAYLELALRSGWLCTENCPVPAARARVGPADLTPLRDALVASATPHVVVSGAEGLPALVFAPSDFPPGAFAALRGEWCCGCCDPLFAARETAEHLARGASVEAWPSPFHSGSDE